MFEQVQRFTFEIIILVVASIEIAEHFVHDLRVVFLQVDFALGTFLTTVLLSYVFLPGID